MTYQTRLVNNTFQKMLYTPMFMVDNGYITESDCDLITAIMGNKPLGVGEQFDAYANDPLNQRNAKTHFINQPDNETSWIYEKLNTIISYYNDVYYGFDLTGYDYLQYTEYEPGGKHEFHMDMALDTNPGVMKNIDYLVNENLRKLTVVLVLNRPGIDYVGGDFQLNHFSENHPITVPAQKGTVMMIPSYMLHRVTPVISGVRKTLVSWVIGPKFR